MWRLHQFTLCPFSRKVRLALGEKGGVVELVAARPWEREEAFAAMNPTGQTPVLEADGALIGDSVAICEYVDEALGRAVADRRGRGRSARRHGGWSRGSTSASTPRWACICCTSA